MAPLQVLIWVVGIDFWQHRLGIQVIVPGACFWVCAVFSWFFVGLLLYGKFYDEDILLDEEKHGRSYADLNRLLFIIGATLLIIEFLGGVKTYALYPILSVRFSYVPSNGL